LLRFPQRDVAPRQSMGDRMARKLLFALLILAVSGGPQPAFATSKVLKMFVKYYYSGVIVKRQNLSGPCPVGYNPQVEYKVSLKFDPHDPVQMAYQIIYSDRPPGPVFYTTIDGHWTFTGHVVGWHFNDTWTFSQSSNGWQNEIAKVWPVKQPDFVVYSKPTFAKAVCWN
jgi:hypothetical protein